jgi:hypothetical protein
VQQFPGDELGARRIASSTSTSALRRTLVASRLTAPIMRGLRKGEPNMIPGAYTTPETYRAFSHVRETLTPRPGRVLQPRLQAGVQTSYRPQLGLEHCPAREMIGGLKDDRPCQAGELAPILPRTPARSVAQMEVK